MILSDDERTELYNDIENMKKSLKEIECKFTLVQDAFRNPMNMDASIKQVIDLSIDSARDTLDHTHRSLSIRLSSLSMKLEELLKEV